MTTPAQIIKRKKALKAYFSKRGWTLPKGFNMMPVAGKKYREAIRRVQKHEWPKLPTTGIADSRVLAVLFPPRKQTFGELALRVAKTQVGTKEHPPESNRGPKVDEYMAACGFHFAPRQEGVPWCACFVTWCLRQVDWKERGWNQAYVPSWVGVAHLAQHGLHTIGSSMVTAGDIVCFDWEDNGVADHIGWCAGPVKGGSFPTIEGNTSAGNNSNGGEVQERTRRVSDVACFIRITQEKA
jgi:hypothetical protein